MVPLAGTATAASGTRASRTGAAKASAAARRAVSLRGPIGLDDWRNLNQLPVSPVGAQTRMFSSFDRTGGNDDGFSGKYSCLRQDAQGCVIAEDTGPGEIDMMAFDGASDYRGNLTVILDGTTVLDAPLTSIVDGDLGAPFVYPLVAPYTISGGNYIYVPMTYTKSMEVITQYNSSFYQVSYRHFASADGVTTFSPAADNASDIISMLKAAGTTDPKAQLPGATTRNVPFQLAPGQQDTLASLHGPGEISAFRLSVPSLLGMTQPPQEITYGGRGFAAGGSSQFTVAINPDNQGVRLTRTFDGTVGDQVADVYVDGQLAGSWQPLPEQWDLWVPETLDIPASLTAGKSQITVKNTFVSSSSNFGEFGYQVDSDVGGQWTETDHFSLGPANTAQEQAHSYTISGGDLDGTATDESLPSTTDPADVAATDDILENARIEISFDGQQTVNVPLGQFFGTGMGKWQINSLFDGVAGGQGGWLSSWWPMPYASSATVTLVNDSSTPITSATAQVTSAPDPEWAAELSPGGHAGYFHATYHYGPSAPGQDFNWLTATGTGKLVGAFMTEEGQNPAQGRSFMEGDQHVWLDGSRSPQINGIGTESIAMGGYYFNYGMFSGAVNGDPWQQGAQEGCLANCTGEYRLWIPDAETFTSGIVAGQEHGGTDDVPVNYGTTAFWYGRPQVTGVQTDSLTIGNPASEAVHHYSAATQCTPYSLTGTFEGDDGPYEGLPPQNYTFTAAQLSSPVSFDLRVDPANEGVALDRTSDQDVGYQAADVYVDGTYAGEWQQQLANPYHRWLDDSFQLPASLTSGHPFLNIRLVQVPGAFPWNAASYRAVSLVAAGIPFAAAAPSAASGAPAAAPAGPAAATSCAATITAVSPATAAAGQQITITGTGFGSTQGDGFVVVSDSTATWGTQEDYWWLGNGSAAAHTGPLTIDSWSDTQIVFTLPGPDKTGGVSWYPAPGTTASVTVVSGSLDVTGTQTVTIPPSSNPADYCYKYDGYFCTADSAGNFNNVYNCSAAQQNLPKLPTATAVNGCDGRIWLHQLPYPQYVSAGWTYCITPMSAGDVPSQYDNPQNVQVTTNTASC